MVAEGRLLIVPRWAGRPESDYYPWLLSELGSAHAGLFAQARVLDLPRPELPDVVAWPAAIAAALRSDPDGLSKTYVLAHSVGCQALLRALAQLPEGAKLGGALCVAGWWEIDQPWDSIRPWLAPVPELARARAALAKLLVLLSDNDPFTADHVKNRKQWEERLGATVRLVPGGRHFNAAQEPEVVVELRALRALPAQKSGEA